MVSLSFSSCYINSFLLAIFINVDALFDWSQIQDITSAKARYITPELVSTSIYKVGRITGLTNHGGNLKRRDPTIHILPPLDTTKSMPASRPCWIAKLHICQVFFVQDCREKGPKISFNTHLYMFLYSILRYSMLPLSGSL